MLDINSTINLNAGVPEFKKIKVGVKKLDDATLDLGTFNKFRPRLPWGDKHAIFKALMENDYKTLRAFSRFFYKSNGIYKKLCEYIAFMYRYDWYIVPEILDDKTKEEKILKDFSKMLNFLDNSYIKKMCGDMALQILIDGCYYGYLVPSNDSIIIQQLPIDYCRTRYSVNGMPAVEFNMAYFDTFRDVNYRMRVLNLFPEEFKKGYILFKKGKLQPDYWGDPGGWYLLTPGMAFKFSINNSDMPYFVNVLPLLLDLDAAQDLDRRKQMQQLLKVIIQKLPLDKNGDLIFDVDEARDIHNNAVAMLQRAIGVDVLTTFADVESIDMSDKNTTTTKDDLAKILQQQKMIQQKLKDRFIMQQVFLKIFLIQMVIWHQKNLFLMTSLQFVIQFCNLRYFLIEQFSQKILVKRNIILDFIYQKQLNIIIRPFLNYIKNSLKLDILKCYHRLLLVILRVLF